jgi:hypothetical protein
LEFGMNASECERKANGRGGGGLTNIVISSKSRQKSAIFTFHHLHDHELRMRELLLMPKKEISGGGGWKIGKNDVRASAEVARGFREIFFFAFSDE